MKKLCLTLTAALTFFMSSAQSVTATWDFGDVDNLKNVTLSGDEAAKSLLTPGYETGSKITKFRLLEASGADTNYTPVQYNPPFCALTPATKVTTKTSGHSVSFTLTPQPGHKYQPRSIAFDAVKIGTDGGGVDVYYKIGNESEKVVETGVNPLRNKISASNSLGFSHHEFLIGDVVADGQPFTITLYIMNLNGADSSSPKEMGFRNITIKGSVDDEISDAASIVKKLTCMGSESMGETKELDLTSYVAGLKNGEKAAYPNKLFGEPSDFNLSLADGYTGKTEYTSDGHTLTVDIQKNGESVLNIGIRFKVTNRQPKPAAVPLKRGLMSLSLTGANMGKGNLVSWRHREADGYGVKYRLYRGTEDAQKYVLNRGLYIVDRTNFLDDGGTADSYYRLETFDAFGNLIESEVSGKTWNDQTFRIPLDRPIDNINGATYNPNDASYCDMDGDGEYEIILKWSPSNEKDAASSGATSPAIFDCIKLDGTRLWRINAGNNFFTSAHTMQFIAWDFDGDGYGEFMMKTGPGTIDGEGNFVVLGDDDPYANHLNSKGKQVSGPEYITVFDGLTGGELATIPYHTPYQAVSTSIWGDDKQNRSERYLAGLAYLDGPEGNPSPIFARGYYAGAFVGAYDWDGTTLKERWVSRNTTKGQGLWGEGAHWMSCGDCDGDGKHEIVYGSAALDHDGSLLYRTGLGHGDALHLGDFLPDREGLEVFMVHEEKPYGYDLRDAKTGERLLYKTASGDTGRGLAAHFDSSSPNSQFLYSASANVHDCFTGDPILKDGSAVEWKIGNSGAGINNRIYWDGDLYDEFYDKSIIAHWNPENKWFDRYKVNNGNYTIGKLNNATKFNPCVLGDLLGDWREEIVLWDGDELIINATSYESPYRIPHLMDDLNYRVQVVNQNCCYNQPPHLSVDPAVKYAGNPNVAQQGTTAVDDINAVEETTGEDVIYNLQGIRVHDIVTPGIYIKNGKKIIVR